MCLEDNLEFKKGEIEEKNATIESLQENVQDLTVELAILQKAPEDASKLTFHCFTTDKFKDLLLDRKGNSLFAEVDDQRQKMKKILRGERAHYLEMKKLFTSKEIEIRQLKRENRNIKEEIQSCSNLIKRGEQIVIQTLTARISELEHDNKSLENRLALTEKQLLDIANQKDLGWIESLLTIGNHDQRDLKDKQMKLMLENSAFAENLQKKQKELAKSRLDCINFKILLGRIVDKNNIIVSEQDFDDLELDHEIFENLQSDHIESGNATEEASPSVFDDGLNESTIQLLGGRELLGHAIPTPVLAPVLTKQEEKENCKNIKSEENLLARSNPHLAAVENIQEQKPNQEKRVNFSEIVESKFIDTTQQQFEESKQARKRPGVIFKKFVIPSKSSKATESS